jgi:demethylmenaquinone methyltransferase/2-methoxy-6-polyprenyl-1,4-benzoquinol methylase
VHLARPASLQRPEATIAVDATAGGEPAGEGRHALVPHLPLTKYYRDESARHRWLREVFDRTAIDYDRIERLMTIGTGARYRRQALARGGLAAGMDVLDVGTGTGLTAIAAASLAGGGARVLGVDPSVGMLASANFPAGMRVAAGCAEALPLDDGSFDFLTMGFALRHVSNLRLVFAEFHRALRPGGRVCVLEITRPTSRTSQRWLKLYMRRLVPMIAHVFGRTRELPDLMRYYWDSIEASVPPAEIVAALSDAGFVDVHRHVEWGIFSEYLGSKPR